MAPTTPQKPAKGATKPSETLHSAASKDIWLAGLGAMAQAQAQARAQGGKAFESLVADGLAFQRKSQEAAQEKINEAAAHFKQLTQGLSTSIIRPVDAKVDRLEHLFEDRVARALQSLGLPTAQKVADLQNRVEKLEAALNAALHKTGTVSSKATPSKAAPRKRATAKTSKATK